MSMGDSKGSSDTKSSNNTGFTGSSSYTPNNLGALQTGWNAANGLLGSQNWSNILGQGVNSTTAGANAANGINGAAGGAVTNFASGDYANNPANAFLTGTANGDYLNSNNPAFQGMVNRLGLALQPAVDGSFAAAGRYGSGANANAFNTALTNEAGNLAYQNYGDERNRQLQAADLLSGNYATGRQQQLTGAGLAPNTVASNFIPAQALTSLGFGGPATYQQLAAMGNPGGSGTSTGTGWGNGTSNTNSSSKGASVSFASPKLFG
jgi:hypothetical protein